MSGATVADFIGYWEAEGQAYVRRGDYEWMASLVPGRRVLEIGCGVGFATQALVRRGLAVLSIDSLPECLEITRQRLAGVELSLLQAEVTALTAEQRAAIEVFAPDTVVCWLMGAPAEVTGAVQADGGQAVVAYREKIHRAVAELAASLPSVSHLHLVDRTVIPWQAKDIGRDTLVGYHNGKTLAGLAFAGERRHALYRKLEDNGAEMARMRMHPSLKGTVPTLASLLAERKNNMLAIIGGSGLTTLSNLDVSHREVVRTPYGEASGALVFGQISGQPAVFLPRHGYGHTIPPHMVNYRANMWALHHHQVSGVISVASVGSIRGDLHPGDIVLPHQIIDYTWGRKSTYFDGNGTPVNHIDFTEPYDAELRRRILEAGEQLSIEVKVGAVYAATQGPRLETAAEINRLERDGADVVGMTGMPEAVLARELGLPYAAINVVANHGAGRGSSANGIHFESLEHVLQDAMGRVRTIIEKLVGSQDACQPLGMSV